MSFMTGLGTALLRPLLPNSTHAAADKVNDAHTTHADMPDMDAAWNGRDDFGPALIGPLRSAQHSVNGSDDPHDIAQQRFKDLSAKFGNFKLREHSSDTIGFKFARGTGKSEDDLVTGMFGERGRLIRIRNNWKSRIRCFFPRWAKRRAKREAAGAAVFFAWKWYQKNGQPFEQLTPVEQACARTYAMQIGKLSVRTLAGLDLPTFSNSSERDDAKKVFVKTIKQRATSLGKHAFACAVIIPSDVAVGGISLADGLTGKLSYCRSYISPAARATSRAFHITRHLHTLPPDEPPLDAERMAVIHTLAHHADTVRISALANGFMSKPESLGFPQPENCVRRAQIREWMGYLGVVRQRLDSLKSYAHFFDEKDGPPLLQFVPCDVDNVFAIKLIDGRVGRFQLARSSDYPTVQINGVSADSAAATLSGVNAHTAALYDDMRGIGASPSAWTCPIDDSHPVHLDAAIGALEEMYDSFKEAVLNVAVRSHHSTALSSGQQSPRSEPVAGSSSAATGPVARRSSPPIESPSDADDNLDMFGFERVKLPRAWIETSRPPSEPSIDYSMSSDDESVGDELREGELTSRNTASSEQTAVKLPFYRPDLVSDNPLRARLNETTSKLPPKHFKPVSQKPTLETIYDEVERDEPNELRFLPPISRALLVSQKRALKSISALDALTFPPPSPLSPPPPPSPPPLPSKAALNLRPLTSVPVPPSFGKDLDERPPKPLSPTIVIREIPTFRNKNFRDGSTATIRRVPASRNAITLGLRKVQPPRVPMKLIEEHVKEGLLKMNTFGTPVILRSIQDSGITETRSRDAAPQRAAMNSRAGFRLDDSDGADRPSSADSGDSSLELLRSAGSTARSIRAASTLRPTPATRSVSTQTSPQITRLNSRSTQFPPSASPEAVGAKDDPQWAVRPRPPAHRLQRTQLLQLLSTRALAQEQQIDSTLRMRLLEPEIAEQRKQLQALLALKRDAADPLRARELSHADPEHWSDQLAMLEWLPESAERLLYLKEMLLEQLQETHSHAERMDLALREIEALHNNAPSIDRPWLNNATAHE